MKNTGLLTLIALTVLFVVFIAGYVTASVTDRSIALSDEFVADDSQSTTADTANRVYIDGLLNINTATVNDLIELPGIGKTLAQNIVTYRDTNGPFESVDKLVNVKGIGNTRLKNLIEYITVSGG